MDDPAQDASGGHGFSEVLRRLAHEGGEELGVDELIGAFGDRAFGGVMFVFALISALPLPPGSTTITGVPLVLMAAQLALGREQLWLPRRVRDASVSRRNFAKGLDRAMPVLRFAERLTRPRLSVLVGQRGQQAVGAGALILAVVLALPIPLGNIAPAISIALLSLGVMQRDGLAVIAGWIGAITSAAILIGAWSLVLAAMRASLRMIGIEF